MTDRTLTLAAGLDRTLDACSGGSVRYLVATVQAARSDTEAEPVLATNVALVIDASGSMSGPKLARAREAAAGVIAALDEGARLSLVSFADRAIVHVEGVHLDAAGRAAALEAVGGVHTRGNTNLGDGWLSGAACVAGGMADKRPAVHRVVLLSDGRANAGMTAIPELAEHAAELQRRGIVTSTVGIGNDYHAPLLQALAEQGGGQMHDAERAEDIVDVVVGELADTRATAVEQAVVAVDLPPGADATLLGFYPVEQQAGRLLVRLGALGDGIARRVVAKLTLPAGREGEALPLRVSAVGTAPGSDRAVAAAPQPLALTFAGGSASYAQPRDEALSLMAAEAWQATAVRTVARLNREGEYRQARHYLERELHYYERYCRSLPGAEEWLRELTQVSRRIDEVWDERTRKEMEYQSFSTSRTQRDYTSTPRTRWSDRLR